MAARFRQDRWRRVAGHPGLAIGGYHLDDMNPTPLANLVTDVAAEEAAYN